MAVQESRAFLIIVGFSFLVSSYSAFVVTETFKQGNGIEDTAEFKSQQNGIHVDYEANNSQTVENGQKNEKYTESSTLRRSSDAACESRFPGNRLSGAVLTGVVGSVKYNGGDRLVIRVSTLNNKQVSLKVVQDRVYLNQKLVYEDIKRLNEEPAYRKTADGTVWYTNMKIGDTMTKAEIDAFEKNWAQKEKEQAETRRRTKEERSKWQRNFQREQEEIQRSLNESQERKIEARLRVTAALKRLQEGGRERSKRKLDEEDEEREIQEKKREEQAKEKELEAEKQKKEQTDVRDQREKDRKAQSRIEEMVDYKGKQDEEKEIQEKKKEKRVDEIERQGNEKKEESQGQLYVRTPKRPEYTRERNQEGATEYYHESYDRYGHLKTTGYTAKGKKLEFNYKGVRVQVVSPNTQQTIVVKGSVTVNNKVVCNDVKQLRQVVTYQISEDGAEWYTNLEVGRPMTPEEAEKFKARERERVAEEKMMRQRKAVAIRRIRSQNDKERREKEVQRRKQERIKREKEEALKRYRRERDLALQRERQLSLRASKNWQQHESYGDDDE